MFEKRKARKAMYTKYLSTHSVNHNINSKKLSREEKRIKKFLKQIVRAVNKKGSMLSLISPELRVQELCDLALKKDALSLQYFPEESKTPANCLKACLKNPQALQYVPEPLKNICETEINVSRFMKSHFKWLFKLIQAVKEHLPPIKSNNLVECMNILQGINTRHQSHQELCSRLINYFSFVPSKYKSYEFCKKVVEFAPLAIMHVPRGLQTNELQKIAVSKNINALRCIPEDLKTTDLCLIAYLKNNKALDFIPAHQQREVVENSLFFNSEKKNISSKEDLDKFIQKYTSILPYTLPQDFIKNKTKELVNTTEQDASTTKNEKEESYSESLSTDNLQKNTTEKEQQIIKNISNQLKQFPENSLNNKKVEGIKLH